MKQRLVGAAVLVALAVIFLPMLVQGPAPDSGVSDVPLSMPDAPRGDYETRDLPLVAPGNTPDGGAVGMRAPPAAASTAAAAGTAAPPAVATPLPRAATLSAPASAAPIANNPDQVAKPPAQPAPEASGPLPAATAAGDYAVSFGSYGTTAAADAVIASLRASQLPATREATIANGKPAWRVRIGPYARRADAEIARLRATHVRDGADARVVALDATPPAAATASSPSVDHAAHPTTLPATVKPPATPVTATPAPAQKPATTSTGFTIQLAAYSQAAEATALRDRLRAAGFTAFTEAVSTDKGTLTRVRVGPAITRAEADQLKAQVKAKLGLDGVVRPYP